jgi:hypothetical protein
MTKGIDMFLLRVQRRLPVSDIGADIPTRSASGDR